MKRSRVEVTLELPDEVIYTNILPRVPVKSLMCFKAVCKSWRSIISSPRFQKSHLAIASSRSVSLVHHIVGGSYFSAPRVYYLLPYKEGSELSNVEGLVQLDSKYHRSNKLIEEYAKTICCDLVGCFDGLLCLHFEFPHKFCLWNPATHEYREIDYPNEDYVQSTYNFGYASSSDDYKIAAIFIDYSTSITNYVCLFSVKFGNWKTIATLNSFEHVLLNALEVYSVYFDDKIYWNVGNLQCSDEWRGIKLMCSVGLDTEQWEEFPWMDWVNEYYWIDLCVIKGHLAFLCRFECNPVSDVWIMERRDDWNSWRKVFNIDVGIGMRLRNVSEDGTYFAATWKQLKLVKPSDDIDTDTAPKFQRLVQFSGYIEDIWFYFDTLVSPFGTELTNEEAQRHEQDTTKCKTLQ